jgi:hypothetical protein
MTPETAIKKQIKDWLKLNGWFVFYCLQGMGAYKGIPDIIAVRQGLTIYVEVKTKAGRQSDHQKQFQADVTSHGGSYIIARGFDDIEKGLHDMHTPARV